MMMNRPSPSVVALRAGLSPPFSNSSTTRPGSGLPEASVTPAGDLPRGLVRPHEPRASPLRWACRDRPDTDQASVSSGFSASLSPLVPLIRRSLRILDQLLRPGLGDLEELRETVLLHLGHLGRLVDASLFEPGA